ncbi:MAG: DNRLRE domain-containing protein, partial [Caldilineaceae bacterium]|nr:DNRLRE domain-containing protein [Caldilineaceae bacterium]
MLHPTFRLRSTAVTLVVAICILFGLLTPGNAAHAAPPAQSVTVELPATQDARIQGGSPDNGFGNGFIWVGTPEGHLGLVQFDLSVLPVDATISGAELRLNFTGVYTLTAQVEVGRIDGSWDEATITWNTRPPVTFGGPIQPVGDSAGEISWNVTPTVAQWQSGAVPNYGFALRGDGALKSFYSRETGASLAPKLVITYETPEPDNLPRPDLGDAPDSTNHHGINNTAYPGTGVLGQFPTVWDVPAGQPAGPRHANQSGEGILGQVLSREGEADLGPDQDGPNNILRNAVTGAVGDVADNDRGDDGWRNRNIKFVDCRKQTLTIRISKAPGATLKKMYLNVWFDGNRDGDWADIAPCQPQDGGPAQAAYEWIVQDHIVDMTAIPAGGFLDFQINTDRVLNHTEGKPHWMRFMLSEARAVQGPGGAFPDGRGPHPGSYAFGETEDVLQRPPLAGEEGTLVLEKRVLNAADPVDYPGTVTYQIRLRHEGGSEPLQAQIRDELPYPLHLLPRLASNGAIVYVEVTSASGGAAPLQADLSYVNGNAAWRLNQLVSWQGTLEPDSEVVLSFDVHVHPLCGALQQTETVHNVAQARPRDGAPITAEATFVAKCPGYDANNIDVSPEPVSLDPGDLSDWTQLSWHAQVRNKHAVPVTLGFYHEPPAGVTASAVSQPAVLARVTLEPDEQKLVNLDLRMESEFSDEVTLADDYSPMGAIKFCILPGEGDACPDAGIYPHLVGEAPQPPFTPRPSDLGDAPDSTNHAGVAMAAYAGVAARYPTVFDPNTGLPQGPRHRSPGYLHLGPLVSREAEADIGPDQ